MEGAGDRDQEETLWGKDPSRQSGLAEMAMRQGRSSPVKEGPGHSPHSPGTQGGAARRENHGRFGLL